MGHMLTQKPPISTYCPFPTRWIPGVGSVSTWPRSTSNSTSTSSSHRKSGHADLQPYIDIHAVNVACRLGFQDVFEVDFFRLTAA